MLRRSRLAAALVVLVAFGGLPAASATAAARPKAGPVRVTAAFDRAASLGGTTALDVDLQLDPRRLPMAPLTSVELEYPQSLGLVSSGLGLAVCTRPASDFAQVLITGPRLGGCPPNAVMGYGTARALVRLVGDGQVIPEYATVTLLSGPLVHGRLGLVVFVDGERPFGAKLAFAGEVRGAAAPYGGTLAMRMPVIPGLEDVAVVSLVELRIVIGSPAIRYYERRRGRVVAYRPAGVALPAHCPAHGFRFRARVAFADGTRHWAATTSPCPRAVVAPPTGR
ncbi:MAG TPA: hypothetical protein VFF79_08850 [Conexibacter sp.]|jgi:hypothetical protein|nr:hypothetical protein [Conexibacter sp.]